MTGPARYRLARTFAVGPPPRSGGLPADPGDAGAGGADGTVRVRIRIGSDTLTNPRALVDFAVLDPFQAYLDEVLDPRFRNGVTPTVPAAPEHLARMLAEWATENLQPAFPAGAQVLSVAVSKAPAPWTEWEVPR